MRPALLALGGLAAAGALLAPVPASSADVTGEVQIMWVDGGGPHVRNATVEAAGGVIVFDPGAGSRPPGGGDGAPEWRVAWPAWLDDRSIEAAREKYAIERYPGPEVLGRRTGVVDIRYEGWLRERIYADRVTDLVLRRELFDANGRLRRAVSFRRLGEIEPATPRARASRAAAVAGASPPFPAPAVLGHGYRRVGVFHHDGAAQVVYSDGVYGLSVFAQEGRLAAKALPAGGRRVRVDGNRGRHYTWAGGEVVVWQTGETVYTVVSDAPAEEVLDAARSMPPGRRAGLVDRLRRVCSGLLRAFAG